MVMDEVLTLALIVIVDALSIKSVPDMPAVKSMQNVPALSTARPQVGVPVALAAESAVIALMVRTPPEAEGAHGSLNVCSANNVVGVPPVDGCVAV